jgi:hypothetical protein
MRSPERQGRYVEDAPRPGHHWPRPTSLSAGKNIFQPPKSPPLKVKNVLYIMAQADLAELAGSGIPRAKTGPAADWQRNLVPDSMEHGSCLFLVHISWQPFNN